MYEARQNQKIVSRKIDPCDTKQMIKIKRSLNNKHIQRFAIPQGLIELQDETSNLIESMKGTDNDDNYITGSTYWAKETKDAAMRKFDEYYLLEQIYLQHMGNDIGFGTDIKGQPDVISNGNYCVRGENKYVTGQLRQVNTNIVTALNQLCTSNRAQNYKGCHLIARINISPISPAAISFQQIEREDQYKLIAKWINTAKKYASLACNNDNNNRLTLIICLDNQTISHVDFPSEEFDLQELSEQEVECYEQIGNMTTINILESIEENNIDDINL